MAVFPASLTKGGSGLLPFLSGANDGGAPGKADPSQNPTRGSPRGEAKRDHFAIHKIMFQILCRSNATAFCSQSFGHQMVKTKPTILGTGKGLGQNPEANMVKMPVVRM